MLLLANTLAMMTVELKRLNNSSRMERFEILDPQTVMRLAFEHQCSVAIGNLISKYTYLSGNILRFFLYTVLLFHRLDIFPKPGT